MARLASAKARRARHPLILVCGKTGRAVCPKAGRKTEVPYLVLALHRSVEFEKILPRVIGITIAHHCPDSLARLREPLSMTMSAHHRGAIGIQFSWVCYGDGRSARILHMPEISSNRRKSTLGVPACRPVTGATRNAQFGDLRIPRLAGPIQIGLRLDVVAKDAVQIPFCDVLLVVGSIGIKK